MELAVDCLVGRVSWEPNSLVGFLLLQFFKVQELERSLGKPSESVVPKLFDICGGITAALPHGVPFSPPPLS